ncbi:hypothetical protein RvY_07516 [Ramazzottius varieornatus]|uniref:Sulfotransferase domain-containing protein n=1 Tax=Ramazzottius varieornatus TaxID=947166 RepID=A0A1D1VBX3_RAMVA|nr:hypothetical protein RvY_07516 [Ramazzottius varieornatus]
MAASTCPAPNPFFTSLEGLKAQLSQWKGIKPPKVYSDPDYLTNYRGCMVNYPLSLNLNELDTFEPRSTDICVAAFPKTGTTWMSALVYMLVNGADPKSLLSGPPLKFKMPYLEMTVPCGEKLDKEIKALDYLKAKQGERTYLTHLNSNAIPQDILKTAKVVYIYRNPKDTIVSMYHFMKAAIWHGFNGSLEQMVDDFVTDKCMNAPFFEHVEGYWKLRNSPNIFVTSYEELSRDPKATVAKLAEFLKVEVTDEEVNAVCRQATFSQMRDNPLTNMAELESLGLINARFSRFFRTGEVGNWKRFFTPEMDRKVDEWIAKNMADRPGLYDMKFEYELDYDLD